MMLAIYSQIMPNHIASNIDSILGMVQGRISPINVTISLMNVCSNFCADTVRMQNGPMRPHIVIVFQMLFVCLSLVQVPESRVTRGSGFLRGGEAYSGGRCKEGCGFQKPWAFWSAA